MTTEPETPDACRDAFEEWLRTGNANETHALDRNAEQPDCYANLYIQGCWQAWQAAWSARKPEPVCSTCKMPDSQNSICSDSFHVAHSKKPEPA